LPYGELVRRERVFRRVSRRAPMRDELLQVNLS
jgi:hypothetical protein